MYPHDIMASACKFFYSKCVSFFALYSMVTWIKIFFLLFLRKDNVLLLLLYCCCWSWYWCSFCCVNSSLCHIKFKPNSTFLNTERNIIRSTLCYSVLLWYYVSVKFVLKNRNKVNFLNFYLRKLFFGLANKFWILKLCLFETHWILSVCKSKKYFLSVSYS